MNLTKSIFQYSGKKMMQHRTFALADKLSVSLCSMLDRVKKKELPRYTALTAGYSGDLSTPTVLNGVKTRYAQKLSPV